MASSKNKRSTDLPARVADRLADFVEPGQRICVALSGGVDSVALLHATIGAAAALNVQLPIALHVHHGLSPNADSWETFCRRLCERLGVAMEVRRVEVKPDGDGLEAAARKARYAELETFDCDWMLLGHHRDDQAETLLLNLLRGAGVHGAAGMAERRGRLLRPLLGVARQEIINYAEGIGLFWVDDESNADSRYSRNFLRLRVMPLLEQPFPHASASLARAAAAFRDAAELLDEVARNDLEGARLLDVSRLKVLSPSRAGNLLAYYLRLNGAQIPGSAMLKEMLRQFTTARRDRDVRFAFGIHEVKCFRDQVFVERAPEPVSPVVWRGENSIHWGSYHIHVHPVVGDGINATACGVSTLRFCTRRGGETLQLRQDGPRRPLKDLWREARVPPWRRKTLPVLYAEDEVIWAAGIGVAAKYRCKPGAQGFLIEFDGVTW